MFTGGENRENTADVRVVCNECVDVFEYCVDVFVLVSASAPAFDDAGVVTIDNDVL